MVFHMVLVPSSVSYLKVRWSLTPLYQVWTLCSRPAIVPSLFLKIIYE